MKKILLITMLILCCITINLIAQPQKNVELGCYINDWTGGVKAVPCIWCEDEWKCKWDCETPCGAVMEWSWWQEEGYYEIWVYNNSVQVKHCYGYDLVKSISVEYIEGEYRTVYIWTWTETEGPP